LKKEKVEKEKNVKEKLNNQQKQQKQNILAEERTSSYIMDMS